MNLLEETLETMSASGLSTDDIIFIGSRDKEYECSWAEYLILANKEYNEGFGGNKVGIDLIIEFKDGHRMYRGEYDGSEWWNTHKPFSPPKHRTKKITRFICGNYSGSVKEICEGEE